ncbi:MAG TPA: PAS domain-containing protein [Candidatus Saccharimonadales bacterium]|nr:PAS domain-containing protein [Candidatus Saccharimonadales bacterium]
MSKPSWWSSPPSGLKYTVTLVSVASAVTVAWLLWNFLHSEAFASVFFCAIILSAWFGGFSQGLLSVTLSALSFDYFFLTPPHSFYLAPSQQPRLIIFVVSALVICFLTSSQRITTESLRRARDDLSINVQQLERTNKELRAENSERKMTQLELRRSQAYLAEAQRLSDTGSFGWKVATGEIIWSDESFRIFEYDRLTKPTVELILHRVHPDDTSQVKQTIERASQDGKDFYHEYRLVMPDGCVKHVHVAAHALSNESESIEFVGSIMDVTERRRTEALLAGEKRLLEMVAGGDSLVRVLDNLCMFVEEQADDVIASILLLDSNGKQLRHGGAPSLPKAFTDAINGGFIGSAAGSCGTAAYHGKQIIVSDIASDPLWANYRDLALAHSLRACWSTPIFSAEGKVIGTFAMYYREPRSPSLHEQEIITQITHLAGVAIQRKLAEDALRQSQAYLAEAQRLSHTGSWASIPDKGMIRYMSEECCRVLGLNANGEQPQFETFFQRIHPDDQARFRESVETAQREKVEFEVDYRIVDPSGEVRDIHSIGHPVLSPSGDFVEFVGTVIEITERKRGEEALRQARAELAHVNRVTTMGELTASLAHEVNQPIAAAITNANTCLRWLTRHQPNLEEACAAAMRIVKDGTRAAEIVRRIHLVFKKSTPERELVDVNDVIRGMIVLLHGEATHHHISFRTELAADLSKVMGDRVELQQLVMNLIVNSIEAMKDSNAKGEIVIKTQPTENEHILVTIIDTGMGLPPHQEGQIFNAFFTTKPHGIGMGLRICRTIVESHGGCLWAGNNYPRGSSFCFTIPSRAEAHE